MLPFHNEILLFCRCCSIRRLAISVFPRWLSQWMSHACPNKIQTTHWIWNCVCITSFHWYYKQNGCKCAISFLHLDTKKYYFHVASSAFQEFFFSWWDNIYIRFNWITVFMRSKVLVCTCPCPCQCTCTCTSIEQMVKCLKQMANGF